MDRFEMMTGHSELVVNWGVDREEALPLGRRFEVPHLAFLPPGVLVGHFGPVVLMLAGSMRDGGEDLSVRSRIPSQHVDNRLRRRHLLVFQYLAEAAFGRFPFSASVFQNIEDVAILVNRSPEIVALATDRDEQLVHVPSIPKSTLSTPQSANGFRPKLPASGSIRLVEYDDATLCQKVL